MYCDPGVVKIFVMKQNRVVGHTSFIDTPWLYIMNCRGPSTEPWGTPLVYLVRIPGSLTIRIPGSLTSSTYLLSSVPKPVFKLSKNIFSYTTCIQFWCQPRMRYRFKSIMVLFLLDSECVEFLLVTFVGIKQMSWSQMLHSTSGYANRFHGLYFGKSRTFGHDVVVFGEPSLLEPAQSFQNH